MFLHIKKILNQSENLQFNVTFYSVDEFWQLAIRKCGRVENCEPYFQSKFNFGNRHAF